MSLFCFATGFASGALCGASVGYSVKAGTFDKTSLALLSAGASIGFFGLSQANAMNNPTLDINSDPRVILESEWNEMLARMAMD